MSKKNKGRNRWKELFCLQPWPLYGLIFIALFTMSTAYAIQAAYPEDSPLVISPNKYNDPDTTSIYEILYSRVQEQPFNLVATMIFFLAVLHTFFSHRFTVLAHHLRERHRKKKGYPNDARYELDKQLEETVSFPAEVMHLLGEVEAVFPLWLIPLFISIIYFYDWHTAVDYIQSRDFTEPMFVICIMTLAATRPIVNLAENILKSVARLGRDHPKGWWLGILTLGPLLGSLITEPAAMKLCAMILTKQFYQYKPSKAFKYATLGLLFVNISIGGVLTHFAAPPVLMVAKSWDWDTPYMFTHFGWKAAIAIFISTVSYFTIFKKEFRVIHERRKEAEKTKKVKGRAPVPAWVTFIHVTLLFWTIFTNHYPALFIAAFLLFLAFYEATAPHQSFLVLRTPLLVGSFLAGLVVHGGLQGWWIKPVLKSLTDTTLMFAAVGLTAFNDNAAITYLSTLVPAFTESAKYAVVAGAVAGGGLTVIANAPNPAGQSLLSKQFEDGIAPMGLLVAALLPTAVVIACFLLL